MKLIIILIIALIFLAGCASDIQDSEVLEEGHPEIIITSETVETLPETIPQPIIIKSCENANFEIPEVDGVKQMVINTNYGLFFNFSAMIKNNAGFDINKFRVVVRNNKESTEKQILGVNEKETKLIETGQITITKAGIIFDVTITPIIEVDGTYKVCTEKLQRFDLRDIKVDSKMQI